MDNQLKTISRYIPVEDDWEYRFLDDTIYLKIYSKDLSIIIEVITSQGVELWTDFNYMSEESLSEGWDYIFNNLFLAIPDYITRDAFLEHGFIDKKFFQELEKTT